MRDYEPSYTINNAMLLKAGEISYKLGRIGKNEVLKTKPHLRKNNRIRSIHSSLKIEANSLSLNDVRDTIDGKTVVGDSKEIREVKNAYKVYNEIDKINPYSLAELKRIHGIMTESLIKESGKFRKGNEGVFSGDTCIFVAPQPEFVPKLMDDLFSWIKENRDKVHPLILSSVFHYEFVFIHPFQDGNGRMARLWQTILLAKWKKIFEYIPLESQIEKYQSEYYDAIAACHKNGNSDVFIEFMLDMIDKVLDETIVNITVSEGIEDERINRLLDVMQPNQLYSALSLMSLLDLKSKDSFRERYLRPAVKAGKIRMSEPENPKSRNQRYFKVR